MAASSSVRFLRFGEFLLDLHTLELTNGGIKIRVPEQSLQILAMLLERPGEVVAREQLHAKLWPNGTIVEFEHSINAAMNRLRTALGDSADEPRYIETLPRRGYRFIFPFEQAPVEGTEIPVPSEGRSNSADLAGRTISHYRVLEKLGQGAMGVVYRAEDMKLGRAVALKFLTGELSDDPRAQERFAREARAASALNHPNICTVYEVNEHESVQFIAMEFVTGKSLDRLIGPEALPVKKVLSYATQMADALAKAHSAGIVHRDLKPSNVMVNQEGLVKLMDFGLAKVRYAEGVAGTSAPPTETTPLTGEGAILGTLQYMAPEQLEGKDADSRTDIFALGTVIYEMATGRKAFEAKSQAGLISAILTAEPPSISTLQRLTPTALDHVVQICVAKEPAMRWQSARDIGAELNWIANKAAVSPPQSLARAGKREQLAWLLAACLFLTLIAAWVTAQLRPVPKERVVQFEVALPEKGDWSDLGVPQISPDGQYVAIVVVRDGQSKIWLRALNSPELIPVRGTDDAQFLFWSPDSRQIAFSTGSALRKISVTGGVPQTICDRGATGPGAWNRDGVILFWPGGSEPLYRVSAMGGEPRAVTRLDQARNENGHAFPSFLPDGKHFMYLSIGGQPATYRGSLDSSEVKRIRDGNAYTIHASGHLLFMRGQRLMAQRFNVGTAALFGDPMLVAEQVLPEVAFRWGTYTASENGTLVYRTGSGERTQLAWCDRSGRRLSTIGEPAEYSNPALSPDQRKVAVGRVNPQTHTRDIWVISLERNTSSRLTFDPADDSNPAWSPDGTRIVFWSDRTGPRSVYVKQASGGGEDQLVWKSNEDQNVEDWSSDGQYLFSGDGAEWLFSFRDGRARRFVDVPYAHGQYRFCPAGNHPPRWFAYESNETGQPQVYVRSFPGTLSGSGGKWQISTGGGLEPMWRGDGKELFYLQDNKLMAVEVNGNGESFQAGISKELFEMPALPRAGRRNRYDIAADGQRFLINALAEQQASSFTVVLNWPALLKR